MFNTSALLTYLTFYLYHFILCSEKYYTKLQRNPKAEFSSILSSSDPFHCNIHTNVAFAKDVFVHCSGSNIMQLFCMY